MEGDAIVRAAQDLRAALKGKQNWAGNKQVQDLRRPSNIFTDIAKLPEPLPTTLLRQALSLVPRVTSLRVFSPRVGSSSDKELASSIEPA